MTAEQRIQHLTRWLSGRARSDLKIKRMKSFVSWWFAVSENAISFKLPNGHEANDETTLRELRGA
jgi:hypothetical protein